jgi:hypothetical protein
LACDLVRRTRALVTVLVAEPGAAVDVGETFVPKGLALANPRRGSGGGYARAEAQRGTHEANGEEMQRFAPRNGAFSYAPCNGVERALARIDVGTLLVCGNFPTSIFG